MPAPTSLAIQNALTAALLAKGLVKQSYDSNGNIVKDPTSLPDGLAKIVAGLAVGDSSWFTTWQAAQIVTIPSTSPVGSPSVGALKP